MYIVSVCLLPSTWPQHSGDPDAALQLRETRTAKRTREGRDPGCSREAGEKKRNEKRRETWPRLTGESGRLRSGSGWDPLYQR